MKNEEQATITIGGEEIPFEVRLLPQLELKYFPENPRIYSDVYIGDVEPTQQEIQERLEVREHVKELAVAIEANQGIIEPLWVHGSTLQVLEGNSRLAAYRVLAQRDPVKWGLVKCHVLPKDLDNKKINSFLRLCHGASGKEKWEPFENAGMLWRSFKYDSEDPQIMAKEEGISLIEIKRLIDVYSFMNEHKDAKGERWSFYYEYFKSRKIQEARKDYPELDSVVVKKIKSKEIPKAEDIRDKLTKIAATGGHNLETFIDTSGSFETCYEKSIEKLDKTALHKTLYKFQVKIGDLDTKRSLQNMKISEFKKCHYTLRKIKQSVDTLLRIKR